MLSKGDNAFIYFWKMTMSSVIYAFKRQQCLYLHFKIWKCLQSFMLSKGDNAFIYISKDGNVFSHLRFQKATMSLFTFQRRQCLHPFTLSKTTMSSSQRLQWLLSLCFIGLDILCFYTFKKKIKKRKKKKKKNFSVLMLPRFHFLGFRQLSDRIARSLERN